MSDQIVLDPVGAPKEPEPLKVTGSPITAATESVDEKTVEQTNAINALGGKMTAGRRTRRVRRGVRRGGRLRGGKNDRALRGGAEIEVKNIPGTPSAGNVNHANVFAGILEAQALQNEQSKYDSLGSAPPMKVGGKRTRRKHNARRKTKYTRKHRGATCKYRCILHSRRRLRVHK